MRGHGPYTTTDGRNFALLGQRHSARAVYGTPAAKLTCALYWSVTRGSLEHRRLLPPQTSGDARGGVARGWHEGQNAAGRLDHADPCSRAA